MRFWILGALLAPVGLWASAAFAGNFAFAVPGDPGLRLTISGYTAAGEPVFSAKSNAVETYRGAPHYIVRVDDAILARQPLGKWCVTGLSGGNEELCDENPRETRGTYLFAGRVPQPEPEPAKPEDTGFQVLVCAADRLARAGYLSPSSKIAPEENIRRAALRFVAVQKDDPGLPQLGEAALEQWCERFDAVEASGVTPLPPLLSKLNFGPDVSVKLARETTAALLGAESFLDIATGLRLKQVPALFISADPAWMTDGYAEETSLPASERANREAQFAACNGGEANYGMMFMCTAAKVFNEDWYGLGLPTQRAYAMVHELFHVVQNELVGPAGNGCCNEAQSLEHLGPSWLVEGGAEYVAFQLLAASGWKNYDREMKHQDRLAADSGVTARQAETRGAYYSNPLAPAVGLVGTYELVGTMGPQVLPRFWQAIGAGEPWENAFEKSFGITVASFYAEGDRRVAEPVTTTQMVACVQGALNSLGFDAGPVDGALGRGTSAAFAAYVEKNDPPLWQGRPLDTATKAGAACLFLARAHGLDDASTAIAVRLARQATFAMTFGAEPEAVKSMAIRDYGQNVVVETDILPMTRRTGDSRSLRSVRIPYTLARDGIEACVFFADGWEVQGADGKGYKGSCDKVDPVQGTLGVLINYTVAPGKQ